jgi:hypothetical protein
MHGIADLPDDSQPIPVVPFRDLGVHCMGRLELSHPQFFPQPQHIKPMPQDMQRSD